MLKFNFFIISELKKSRKRCPLCWYRLAKTLLIWNCSPCWLKLKEFIHMIIMDPFTDLVLTICIILNVCFLTLECYPMSEETNSVLTIGNLVRLLYIIFICGFNFSSVVIILIILFCNSNMLQMHYMHIRWSITALICSYHGKIYT